MVFLTIGILLLGFFWIRRSINRPFGPTTEEDYAKIAEMEQTQAAIAANTNQARMIAKQSLDSDQDGLSDFMEEYVYKTSAYLPDSDSDGRSDKVEIETGTNPLCPEGKTCSGITETTADEYRETGMTPENLLKQQQAASGGGPSSFAAGLSGANLSASAIREILIGAGVPAESLAAIDDATLVAMYNQALAKASAQNSNVNSADNIGNIPANNITSGLNINTIEDLKKLTPDELRALLAQAGIPAATLEMIDDITLMENLAETIKQMETMNVNVHE